MSSVTVNGRKTRPQTPFYRVIDGFCLPGFFTDTAFRSALAYKPRPDDLFIVTYPKCGTTWLQNIVTCILRNGKPVNCSLEFFSQAPFLEAVGAEAVEKMKRPGSIKTHLPFNLTPWSQEAKYIYLARNPKDCCVSFYHHTEKNPAYKFDGGAFEDYFELFMEGMVNFGDYFDNLLSWYEHRNDPNVLFLTYEEMKKDTEKHILKIAEFMGPQYRAALEKTGHLLRDVIYYSSFTYMKENQGKYLADLWTLPKEFLSNNPDIPQGIKEYICNTENAVKDKPFISNSFVRKGVVGDWKNYFSPAQNVRMEEKFRERVADTHLPELWKDVMYCSTKDILTKK